MNDTAIQQALDKHFHNQCPNCSGVKCINQSICFSCLNRQMMRFRSDPRLDSFQGDGFSVSKNSTSISCDIHYTDIDGRHRYFWKEMK